MPTELTNTINDYALPENPVLNSLSNLDKALVRLKKVKTHTKKNPQHL